MFSACSSSKNCLSARCPSAANIFCRDVNVFGTKSVSLNHMLKFYFLIIIKIFIVLSVNFYIYCNVSGVPWLIITGSGLDHWIYRHFYYNCNQLQSMTAHNRWLSKTRCIPYSTTSVFSSTMTDLVLIYESVTYGLRTTDAEWRLTYECPRSESESYVPTDGQPASQSWNKAPIWGLRPDFYYCLTVAGLLIWGALSDERTGLSFTIDAGPRQRSHFRVRVQ
jgi:hypothetical protein